MNGTENMEPKKTAVPARPVERLVPNPKLRLREQFHEVCRFKRMAERTERSYWDWVRRFLVFYKEGEVWRHPRQLGGAEVCTFLSHLATARKVSASTQNQALNALVFFYRENGGTPKTCTMSGAEFLRRFLQHVLPRGFQRVRHYGWQGAAAKEKRARRCWTGGRRRSSSPRRRRRRSARSAGNRCG